MNERPPEPAEVSLHLRWGDMDINKHVNNVQFARLFEEARVRTMSEWFAGRPWGTGAFHIARQEIEFVAPLLYSTAPAVAKVWISRVGTSSFDFGAELRDDAGNLKALCETTGVTVDSETGASHPIPDEVRVFLHTKVADPVPFRRRS
jgi:acyl-CoA thioester hydrolase